ncbi:hypothetical protein [Clostridium saccharoperbutylacetonicum]
MLRKIKTISTLLAIAASVFVSIPATDASAAIITYNSYGSSGHSTDLYSGGVSNGGRGSGQRVTGTYIDGPGDYIRTHTSDYYPKHRNTTNTSYTTPPKEQEPIIIFGHDYTDYLNPNASRNYDYDYGQYYNDNVSSSTKGKLKRFDGSYTDNLSNYVQSYVNNIDTTKYQYQYTTKTSNYSGNNNNSSKNNSQGSKYSNSKTTTKSTEYSISRPNSWKYSTNNFNKSKR